MYVPILGVYIHYKKLFDMREHFPYLVYVWYFRIYRLPPVSRASSDDLSEFATDFGACQPSQCDHTTGITSQPSLRC